MLDRWAGGNYGGFTGVAADIVQWLGVAQIGATVFGTLDTAIRGTGYNPNDQYAYNGGGRVQGYDNDGFVRGGGQPQYAMSPARANFQTYAAQLAAQRGGGVAGAEQPIGVPLNINAYTDNSDKPTNIKDLVDRFNAHPDGGGAQVKTEANGNMSIVFESELARDKFFFGPFKAELAAIRTGKAAAAKPAATPAAGTAAAASATTLDAYEAISDPKRKVEAVKKLDKLANLASQQRITPDSTRAHEITELKEALELERFLLTDTQIKLLDDINKYNLDAG
jgi:hypothetical protein